jgi:hypothetical protein
MPATCGDCCRSIDLDDVMASIKARKRYEHGCGKVLFHGGTRPESLRRTLRARGW